MTQHPVTPMRFTLGKARLHGDLCVPPDAVGLVVFVHGSGSSRHSPRNQSVAHYFNGLGLATLLFDLLTADEQAIDEITRQLRFDIPLLSQRLSGVVDQLGNEADLRELRIGLFGASTGAAAALITAASRPADIAAVVSRGGRVDLADQSLARVKAASLFLVGSRDLEVLELNREAAARLQCVHQLQVVPGATHLFEEHGTLEQVAQLAGDWFVRHLV
ncbi:alpha/beta hydrolase [Stutzerimonas decontaminans]|uniref:Alpha/beta hydrolase n=2 Tax=Stutzerimonas TaxID=2901164 RepID=A0ABX4VTA0_9GAMM|nr:dienelactone hydrolase family protein [Stutzerimonas decontaminans]AHY44585.1 hydrolase [Stutzerimonas decontaminans]MCQ4244714.1 dienelactone hydrolase family protein [Stutzerimonas decontaminans]PNF83386.1 alpha/beta hydrolase [Stutzerimonas decontaminans]